MLETAKTNCPSCAASRATTAFQRWSSLDSALLDWTPRSFAELERAGISLKVSFGSMAFGVIVGKARFVEVMMGTAYGEEDQRTIRILRAKRNRVASELCRPRQELSELRAES